MTYFMYVLWCITLYMAAAELDKYVGWEICDRWLSGIAGPYPWYMPAAAALALPGAGQLLNRQPVKAAVALLGAIAIAAAPRPPQLVAVALVWLMLPWYSMVVVDALVYGILRRDTIADLLDWDEDDLM